MSKVSKFKFKRTGLHNTIMSHIKDDIWNKWCLITFATYKNNYKNKPTSRSYCYTLSHSWDSDGEYELWLYFMDRQQRLDISFIKLNEDGSGREISNYSTPLYLDNESWVKLADYISQILDSPESRKMRWGK